LGQLAVRDSPVSVNQSLMLRVSIYGTPENFRKRPGAVLINVKEYAVDDLLPDPFHLVP